MDCLLFLFLIYIIKSNLSSSLLNFFETFYKHSIPELQRQRQRRNCAKAAWVITQVEHRGERKEMPPLDRGRSEMKTKC